MLNRLHYQPGRYQCKNSVRSLWTGSFGRVIELHNWHSDSTTTPVALHITRAAAATSHTPKTDGDRQLRERLAGTIGVGVVTDDAVPEGHKGLHGFLYGEGGAGVHDGGTRYDYRQEEDDGTAVLPVAKWLPARDGEKPLGVYAIYDLNQTVQYVAYSRNVVLAVKAHLARMGSERCAFVRCMVFANKAMATRSNLQQEANNWVQACAEPPPGNGPERHLWEGQVFDSALMSEVEVMEYEDKKLKMRKAMGENLHDDPQDETQDAKTRRLRLLQAVEGDNWSSVIEGQTDATVDPAVREAAREASAAAANATIAAAPRQPRQRGSMRGIRDTKGSSVPASSVAAAIAAPDTSSSNSRSAVTDSTSAPQQIVSPFMRAAAHREAGEACVAPTAMTVGNVDKALDTVRPYLIADGGNVEVAAVENGDIFLRLQGACGTCPSSTATMKMGIERSLRATFGEVLREVIQVGAVDTRASAASVDAHLEVLRPAIKNYGGMVEVLAVVDGVARVYYTGPPAIAMGITAAIKDKFPDIKQVILQADK